MLIRAWLTQENLSVRAGAPRLGLSATSLSDILRGKSFPAPGTIAQIEGATAGAVTIADHWANWRRRNATEYSQFRAVGRAASKTSKIPAKTRKT